MTGEILMKAGVLREGVGHASQRTQSTTTQQRPEFRSTPATRTYLEHTSEQLAQLVQRSEATIIHTRPQRPDPHTGPQADETPQQQEINLCRGPPSGPNPLVAVTQRQCGHQHSPLHRVLVFFRKYFVDSCTRLNCQARCRRCRGGGTAGGGRQHLMSNGCTVPTGAGLP